MSDRPVIICGMCTHYSGPIGKRCGLGPIPATGRPHMNPDQSCDFGVLAARYAPPEVLARGFDAIREWQDAFKPAVEPAKAPAAAPQPPAEPSAQGNLF